MPKISVIIPVYNVEKYLRKCLDSVIEQTFEDLEIICVNDCSPDKSAEILEEYKEKDNRIKIINREKNGGLSAARNSGLDVATGEYIYFLDSDDWIDLDYLEKMYSEAKKSGAEIVLNTNILSEIEGQKATSYSYGKYFKAPENGEFVNKVVAIHDTPCMVWAHFYKKSFLCKYKLKFPDGYIHEDYYFQYVSKYYVDSIFAFHGPAYHYLQRNSSIMSSRVNKVIPYVKIAELIYDYYSQNGILESFKVKICNIGSFLPIKDEETFCELKHFFEKLKEYFRNNKVLFNDFEQFCILRFYDIASYKEFCLKYKSDLRLEYIKNNLKKSEGK